MPSQIVPSDSYIRFLSPPAPKPAPVHIKDILPDYRITEVLGSGGFADVYAGTDARGKQVAIKIPQMKLDTTIDSSIIDNFEKETDIWKNLEHPNIVGIYSANNQPLPHIVMEMMNGGSLQSLMKHHKLTVDETVNIMLQVLEALSYSHRMATVHRDLKPENILFTNDGVAKITDWGIGKFMASTAMTQTMGVKGTLAYSAPEQFDNKKYGKVDWQTDIFQVGVVFYEMLTGVNPFAGDGMAEVVGKVIMHEPDLPSSLNPNVPNKLDKIVMGALKKEKGDRWRTDVMLYHLKELTEKGIQHSETISNSPIVESLPTLAPVWQEQVQPMLKKEPYYTSPPPTSLEPKKKKNGITIAVISIIIIILLIGAGLFISYFWVVSVADTDGDVTIMAFEVRDGVNKDATHGCFFTIRAKQAVDIDPSKYTFYVTEQGRSPQKLDFAFRNYEDHGGDDFTPVGGDRNMSYRYDDKNWKIEGMNVEATGSMWSDGEYIGFDMPMIAMGIDLVEGKVYEVMIKDPNMKVVCQEDFIYQRQMTT